MNKPFVWILGGVDKGNDYTELIKVAKEKKIKAIICLGDENKKIKESFKSVVDIIEEAKDMHEAVNKSYAIASSGDAVLLSPHALALIFSKILSTEEVNLKKWLDHYRCLRF